MFFDSGHLRIVLTRLKARYICYFNSDNGTDYFNTSFRSRLSSSILNSLKGKQDFLFY